MVWAMPGPFSYPVTAHRWHLCDASGNSEVCTGMAGILCQVQVGRKALLTGQSLVSCQPSLWYLLPAHIMGKNMCS